jgi:hypothetical protein
MNFVELQSNFSMVTLRLFGSPRRLFYLPWNLGGILVCPYWWLLLEETAIAWYKKYGAIALILLRGGIMAFLYALRFWLSLALQVLERFVGRI